ncbi:endonuclease/exonuclease/phosphatase family protein [Jannaschia ovalis]|uniref:Endonuclease/exonuclease/phosphatase family protein n=1 Tax=Jannaschia ovalis TaxID=3038773 RepID=A0ABY8L799_9RHOB|nr:endonuclease/exonuclease/phosphatase family protein [Jannaschia sp. GRR-S6-38]WGH77260.1 endonuclease/exonuclease/phosphatase family protein [Jannaschia sp. GRR-S6-38]
MTRRLRVASWNIRKAFGLDWRRDPARVLRVLELVGPDVALLQEADKRLPPRPPALPPAMMRAAGWDWVDADPDTPSIGHHGNAVLMRQGIAAFEVIALDLPGLEPRGAALVRLEGGLVVGALHLGLRRIDRLRQLRRVVGTVRRMGGPVLLGGDLNEWGRLPLPRGWQEVAPGPSFHAQRPTLRLDRFLAGPGVGVSGSGVLARSHALRASDHLPIWVDLEL